MGKPFPALSKTPAPASWREEPAIDPTLSVGFESGHTLTRPRYTFVPTKFSFYFRYLTQADKDLIVQHQIDVGYGGSVFTFRHPKTQEDFELRYLSVVRFGIERGDYTKYNAESGFNYETTSFKFSKK